MFSLVFSFPKAYPIFFMQTDIIYDNMIFFMTLAQEKGLFSMKSQIWITYTMCPQDYALIVWSIQLKYILYSE